MTLRCIAVDDEHRALKVIEQYAARVDGLDLVAVFRSPLKALGYLHDHPIDLIFLDIDMPDLSGMHFLKSLALRPLVILTTAYPEYAVESYEYDVVDYLLKPIEFDRFLKAVNKALAQLRLTQRQKPGVGGRARRDKKEREAITVKSGTELRQIRYSEILCVESAGNYVVFVTKQEEIMSLMTMKDVVRLLPSDIFHRVHRSYLVGLRHITRVGRRHVTIADRRIPIGNHYRQSFLAAIKRV